MTRRLNPPRTTRLYSSAIFCGGLATLNALRAHHASHRQPSDFGTDRGSIFTCSSSWHTSRNTTPWLDNRSCQPYLQIDYNIGGYDVTLRHHAAAISSSYRYQ
jgi:hypothetical protein